MKKFYFLSLATAAVLVIFTALMAIDIKVSAANTTQVVTETEITRQAENTPPTDSWVLYTRAAGTGTFRTGPGSPPAGIGSLEFITPTGADKVFLFNYDHVGTPLSTINAISYWTYRTAGSEQQVTAINIQVDYNGAAPGGFTTLVFEPVYNTSQGSVQNNVWQNWDAFNGGNGIWWSSNPIPSAPNRDTFVTWNTIIASNPDAIIVGGFGVNQGSGNPALTASSDKLSIGYGGDVVTYDFEPYRIAQTRDDCKVGGWQSFKRADGTSFSNQGDCVSYINTGN